MTSCPLGETAATTQQLPPNQGEVIIPADGRERITAVVNGVAYCAREAVTNQWGQWMGVWRSAGGVRSQVCSEHITPGTWKVDDQ